LAEDRFKSLRLIPLKSQPTQALVSCSFCRLSAADGGETGSTTAVLGAAALVVVTALAMAGWKQEKTVISNRQKAVSSDRVRGTVIGFIVFDLLE
jgi:hypothetical protein